jgi:hypothetical protein
MLGPDVHRVGALHTDAKADAGLLRVWLKSPRRRLATYRPSSTGASARGPGRALAVAGTDLPRGGAPRLEDVQAALRAIRLKDDGSLVNPASVNTYVAAGRGATCVPTAITGPTTLTACRRGNQSTGYLHPPASADGILSDLSVFLGLPFCAEISPRRTRNSRSPAIAGTQRCTRVPSMLISS